MLAPDNVTMPEVVLFNTVAPPNFAVTVPLCISNVPVLVKTPLVPVMLPDVRVTVPTVSENASILNVPPLTVIAPELIALETPSVKVPALTVVKPR